MYYAVYKIVAYIPHEHLESVKDAMFDAGAGHFAKYSHCAWQVRGMGQFRPLQGANPHTGQIDALSQVDEWRVEMMVPENKLREVVSAYKKAHPYEVPAYEVYQTVDVEDF